MSQINSRHDGADGAEPSQGQMIVKASRHSGRGAVSLIDATPAAPAALSGRQLLQMALWSLRGRYLLAAILGVFVAALFGYAGWRGAKLYYTSEGLIRIAYSLPSIVPGNDNNRAMPNFDAFMLSQRTLMTTRRVTDLALQDPVWRQYGRTPPSDGQEFFYDVLKVDVRPRSEYISVSATTSDPAMAAAAVTSIIHAYEAIYKSQEKEIEQQLVGVLQDKQQLLLGQIGELDERLRVAEQEYGTTDLAAFYQGKQARLNQVEQGLNEATMAKLAATAPATQPAGAAADAQARQAVEPERQELSAEQIALTDQTMNGFLQEQLRLETQLKQYAARGFGEAHRDVLMARTGLDDISQRIARRVRMINQVQANAAPAVSGGSNVQAVVPGAPPAPRTLQQLAAREAQYQNEYKKIWDELKAIGNKRLEMQRIQTDLTAKQSEVATLTRRIEQLKDEGSLPGRLSVVSTGGMPGGPVKDRRIQFAGAGAFAGLFLPATMILLVSLLWRKYRFSDETEADVSSSAPLLGILPELKGSAADGDQRTAAAHSVHQIRVSLQARALREGRPESQVYLFTSSAAGEGKTTLAASLALSFAASRLRTLVIDCDLVGRHLTSSLQAQELEGLNEALQEGTIRGRVRKTDAGLYVLTAGVAGATDAPAMSPAAVRAVLEEARRHFHVILLDTGPVLGSIEAAVLAQEADGAVMVIARGQQRSLVQKAMRRLRSLGTPVLGFVFNRARPQDFHQSVCTSTAHAADSVLGASPSPVAEPESLMRFGPVVRAVATNFPAPQDGQEEAADAEEAADESREEAGVA
ncbi:MAG TPA: P-loop NTPase [Tepidisphaeraceae bacterium]|nr:P-loop NTPase [Tepidisphaeraceae bacterium]